MKKMVLALSLSLAALGFLLSPAMVAASPDPAAPALSAEDLDFLASLAIVPAGTPAPELAAKRPAISPKSLCTATANCFPGTVTCSSNTSVSSCSAADRNCNVERGHVTCDGSTTWCPTACPGCPPDWCTEDCDSSCPCGGTLSCNASLCTSHCNCKHFCPP
ncbi:MAG TPA: hypothetical protein VLX28_25600 [Thermoanaerobaculia bacterium]|nr:hypothetical protein [Thermoanaerobaculia bacterium]